MDYYAVRGPHGDPFAMGMEAWSHFCSDAKLIRSEDDKADAEDVHVQCCVEKDHATTNLAGKRTLCRHQFVEAYVRMVDYKFGLSRLADEHISNCRLPSHKYVMEAFAHVLNDLQIHLPRGALQVHDKFRKTTLYTENVDDELSKHKKRLNELYTVFAARRGVAGGLHFGIETFGELVGEAGLRCEGVTHLEEKEIFLSSKMYSIDDLSPKHKSLTFVDFLEALCRTFDAFPVPSRKSLEALRSTQVTEFFVGIAKLIEKGTIADQKVFDLLAPDPWRTARHEAALMFLPTLECLSEHRSVTRNASTCLSRP